MRPRAAEHHIALWVVLTTAVVRPLAAQDTDAPRAPRIIDSPAPAAPAPSAPAAATPLPPEPVFAVRRPPNAARLAPLPEERSDAPEEIIVIGQGWRLPDLGSEWRERQKEAANDGRFSATVLPLYDPAEPPIRNDTFATSEQRRHGYIELFRLRFGRRSNDEAERGP
jgi:hypothetical protein